jgi:hypothetical protein
LLSTIRAGAGKLLQSSESERIERAFGADGDACFFVFYSLLQERHAKFQPDPADARERQQGR